MIPFNKPYLTGNETKYIEEAVFKGKISGNGDFTKLCHEFFKDKYKFKNCLLTTSCTDALEMSAILANIKPGDQVILPSYTFVSTANAFALRGADLVFIDSSIDHPGLDESCIASLITEKTRAIVVVHYAGVSCNMSEIMSIAEKNNIIVIEDAAQAIDSYYISKNGKKQPLGSVGHLSAFSFHETKNIISGEGGMLVINDERFKDRAEIIWEKGTNRSAFFRGEVDKYSWVDIGSSFLPSDVISAFLYAQLESLEKIQSRRALLWDLYYNNLKDLKELIKLPQVPEYATNNSHMFYIICKNLAERDQLIKFLKGKNILAVFHYQSLHKSAYYKNISNKTFNLPNSDFYSNCLIRLPLYYELQENQVCYISDQIHDFFYEKY